MRALKSRLDGLSLMHLNVVYLSVFVLDFLDFGAICAKMHIVFVVDFVVFWDCFCVEHHHLSLISFKCDSSSDVTSRHLKLCPMLPDEFISVLSLPSFNFRHHGLVIIKLIELAPSKVGLCSLHQLLKLH